MGNNFFRSLQKGIVAMRDQTDRILPAAALRLKGMFIQMAPSRAANHQSAPHGPAFDGPKGTGYQPGATMHPG